MKSKIVALSKNEDFKNLLKKKKVSNKYITLFFGPLADKDNKKLNISFVVKKKLIRGAVKRNKIKRRLRNIMNEAVKKVSINFKLFLPCDCENNYAKQRICDNKRYFVPRHRKD